MSIGKTTELSSVTTSQLVDGSVTSAKIAAGAVNTAKIDSTGGSSGWLLTANGSGGVSFSSPAIAAIQFNTQTAAYTLALTDKDKIVQANSTAAFNITIPPNSSVAFATGDQVHVLQVGSGQTTIAAGTGVTANATPGLKCRAQWSAVTIIKRDTNTWVVIGDLSA